MSRAHRSTRSLRPALIAAIVLTSVVLVVASVLLITRDKSAVHTSAASPTPSPSPSATPTPTPTPVVPTPTPVVVPAPPPKPKPASRLAGRPWGAYSGGGEMLERAPAYIAKAPKARWFGPWISSRDIYGETKAYIANAQAGNPRKLVQLASFGMEPWYKEAERRAPSRSEAANYRTWIDNQAKAIGNAPVAIILQPDLTFLRTVPNFGLSSGLIRYAAQRYGALPNALVYLEAGAWDWPHPAQGGAPEAVRLLKAAGVQYVDGIATNSTHYSSTKLEVQRVAEIIQLLQKSDQVRYQDFKGVINTSSSGNPFEFGDYTGGDPDEAFPCTSRSDRRTCVTLGIPPTARVADPQWGLDPATRKLARKYVDGYLWFGRPWLRRQAEPFLADKAQTMIRSSPWGCSHVGWC